MIVHLNGKLLERAEARIDPLDRGSLFGEGIYEGLRAISWSQADGPTRIVGLDLHVRRMQTGLAEVGLDWDPTCLGRASVDLLAANGVRDAFVYWQVTGGAPGPDAPPRSRVRAPRQLPTVLGFCETRPGIDAMRTPKPLKAVTLRDIRWEMGAVKSISLMGNLWLARQAAARGADDAVLVRDGLVTEGLATNVIVALPDERGGVEVVTPSLESAPMLAGVTRALLVEWAGLIERPLRAEDLRKASEIMLTGTNTFVASIVNLDGRAVSDGKPGPVASRLARVLVDGYRDGRDLR